MSHSTITSKGQITIPKDIRSILDLSVGDRINFIIQEDGQVVFKPQNITLSSLKGSIRKPKVYVSIEEMDEAIIAAASTL